MKSTQFTGKNPIRLWHWQNFPINGGSLIYQDTSSNDYNIIKWGKPWQDLILLGHGAGKHALDIHLILMWTTLTVEYMKMVGNYVLTLHPHVIFNNLKRCWNCTAHKSPHCFAIKSNITPIFYVQVLSTRFTCQRPDYGCFCTPTWLHTCNRFDYRPHVVH